MDKLIDLEEKLVAEIDDRIKGDQVVNYRGDVTSSAQIENPQLGDTAVIGGYLQRYNGNSWESFNGLSQKLYYINGEASDKIFFTDQNDNVTCYIDAAGLHTFDIQVVNSIDMNYIKTNGIENSAANVMYFDTLGAVDINI